MTKKGFPTTLLICALIALTAAFLFVSPAFAQDEVPPEVVPAEAPMEVMPTNAAPAEAVTPDVPGEAIQTEAAPEEVLAVEPTVTVPVDETPAAEPSLAEALDEAGLVLADASGEPLAMATQSSEQLINNGDPYLWVGTTKYSYMVSCGTTSNCTEDPNPIQRAIDDIKNGVRTPTDKTLYFEANSIYDVSHIQINDVVNLTRLMGAVDPTTGVPSVTINVVDYLEISYQNSGFTIYGFNINGDTTLKDPGYGALDIWVNSGILTVSDVCLYNADPEGLGLSIGEHNGAVILQNVESSDNVGGGAYIYTRDSSVAPVTIKNSSFNRNQGNYGAVNGIAINTRGSLTLDGVSANDNLGSSQAALHLIQSGNLTIKNSVFNGNSNNWAIKTYQNINGIVSLDNVFANNNFAGIGISGSGNFTINNVHGNNNDRAGGFFDSCLDLTEPFDTCSNPGVGNITITNSEFNQNISNNQGLFVVAKGAITLTNVDASDNRGYDRDTLADTFTTAGARLQNYGSLAVYPVTVNNSTFNRNSDDGLEIRSKGLVTVNKVHADNNGTEVDGDGNFVAAHDGYGMDIDNTSGTTAGVTFNGSAWGDNSTYGNAHGLHINTRGAILLNNLDSSYNSFTNAELKNDYLAANVTINKSTFLHSWSGNGLEADSFGVITLSTVYAAQNFLGGAILDNSMAGSAKAVTITNSTFSSNQGTGLYVRSKGAITLKNAQAFDNSVHQLDFPSGVYTVHDVFGLGGSEDLWTVDVTVDMLDVPYNAVLGSYMANGILDIRDPSGETIYTDTAVSSGESLCSRDNGLHL